MLEDRIAALEAEVADAAEERRRGNLHVAELEARITVLQRSRSVHGAAIINHRNPAQSNAPQQRPPPQLPHQHEYGDYEQFYAQRHQMQWQQKPMNHFYHDPPPHSGLILPPQHHYQQHQLPQHPYIPHTNEGDSRKLSVDAPEYLTPALVEQAEQETSKKKKKTNSKKGSSGHHCAAAAAPKQPHASSHGEDITEILRKLGDRLRTVEGRQGALQSKVAAADTVLGRTGSAWTATLQSFQRHQEEHLQKEGGERICPAPESSTGVVPEGQEPTTTTTPTIDSKEQHASETHDEVSVSLDANIPSGDDTRVKPKGGKNTQAKKGQEKPPQQQDGQLDHVQALRSDFHNLSDSLALNEASMTETKRQVAVLKEIVETALRDLKGNNGTYASTSGNVTKTAQGKNELLTRADAEELISNYAGATANRVATATKAFIIAHTKDNNKKIDLVLQRWIPGYAPSAPHLCDPKSPNSSAGKETSMEIQAAK
jgi:hypothetical protein